MNPLALWIAAAATLAAAAFTSAIRPSGVGARSLQAPVDQPAAEGRVFHDANRNGALDPGERGIEGVRVSDQRVIVRTDREGRWRIPLEADGDTKFFVIKPRGWMTPVDENQLPKFYYIHKPSGSPPSRFPGVKPTGPLPKSIDFPLTPQEEPSTFRALFFGDTQPRDEREVDYIRRDIVEPLIGHTQEKFGVTLGDIVFDDLSVFGPLVKTVALIGVPWYNVIGNHDLNTDAPDDERSDETYESWFGPNYFSWDWGPVHFVALDNVHWQVNSETKRGSYRGFFGQEQLRWLEQDLKLIPETQLVVFTMHIPLAGCDDRAEFFRLIENRPYTLSVSAHTHYQEHVFFKEEDGWHGKRPHHHVVNVTACGSWWEGSPDEYGIPHTTMRCGAPNGYAVFSFNGNQYSIEFRAARREKEFQMTIYAPERVPPEEAPGTPILVNVFGGSERSEVEMRFGDGDWRPMQKVAIPDPEYAKMFQRDRDLKAPYRPLPSPINSPHLWRGVIPRSAKPGMIPIQVRTTDMFGQRYFATRGVRIE